MNRDTVIYVAGALTAKGDDWKQHSNIQAAARVARRLWVVGYTAICPHLNNLHFDGPNLPTEDIQAGDLVLIERCDALVVVPGHLGSKGTRIEIDFAKDLGIPVYYWPYLPEVIYPRDERVTDRKRAST